jgi:hypothetical protein
VTAPAELHDPKGCPIDKVRAKHVEALVGELDPMTPATVRQRG